MKKILFCLQTMVCGGVEQELITILKRFDLTEYKISVLLFYSEDIDMENKIPADINIINLAIDKKYYCGSFVETVAEHARKGKVIEALKIAVNRLLKGISVPASICIDEMDGPDEEYDFAVCYHMHSPIVLKYVAEKIRASVKYAWIHNDFSTTGLQIEQYEKWLSYYRAFYGVSKRITEEFKELCPAYADKAHTCHNIVDVHDIQKKSQDLSLVEKKFLQNNSFKIVTVGRFVEQKGFDLAIKAAALLRARGAQFTWYAVGYGKDEPLMRAWIEEYNVKDCFVILGRKDNPYPYMYLADLYAQPSRHEGFGLTLAEAIALKKCIVATNFAGAAEQIDHNETGIIVGDFTAEAICDAVFPFIVNEEYRRTFLSRISTCDCEDGWMHIQEVFR